MRCQRPFLFPLAILALLAALPALADGPRFEFTPFGAYRVEMRHGRKSKSKRFNGYKRHIPTDLDSDLILAGAITPANRPEEEAAPELQAANQSNRNSSSLQTHTSFPVSYRGCE